MKQLRLTSLASACTALVTVSCTGAPLGVEPVATSDSEPSAPRSVVINAPDFAGLFATPTLAELQAMRADWASRNPVAVNASIIQTAPITISNTSGEVRVISHEVDGFTHYGAVFVPFGLPAGSAAMVGYAHGGNGGISFPGGANYAVKTLETLAHPFVYVMPAYRSEPLSLAGVTWVPDGPASPWDRDVDDALALMDAAVALIPEADTTKRLALGTSRGAAVALLMGIRDPQFRAVVSLAAPLTYYDPGGQFEVMITNMANGQPAPSPLMDILNQQLVQPWVAGQLPLADMRSELIRRSIPLFAADLPQTQYHHGTADRAVDVSQAQVLIDSMTSLGRVPPDFEPYLYQGGGHLVTSLTGSEARIRAYVDALWAPPPLPPGDAPPVASYTYSCTAAQLCTFDATGSTDDNGITLYEWLVGPSVKATGSVIQHQFPGPFTLPLSLRVTDTIGQTNTQTQTVIVP